MTYRPYSWLDRQQQDQPHHLQLRELLLEVLYRQQWFDQWKIGQNDWRLPPQHDNLRKKVQKISKWYDMRKKQFASLPEILPMEDRASNTWALEILGTQSMPNAVSFFLAKASMRSLFCPGYKKEYRMPPSLNNLTSSILGWRNLRTMSWLKAVFLSTILAPEAS